jgi:hypothetical protein
VRRAQVLRRGRRRRNQLQVPGGLRRVPLPGREADARVRRRRRNLHHGARGRRHPGRRRLGRGWGRAAATSAALGRVFGRLGGWGRRPASGAATGRLRLGLGCRGRRDRRRRRRRSGRCRPRRARRDDEADRQRPTEERGRTTNQGSNCHDGDPPAASIVYMRSISVV